MTKKSPHPTLVKRVISTPWLYFLKSDKVLFINVCGLMDGLLWLLYPLLKTDYSFLTTVVVAVKFSVDFVWMVGFYHCFYEVILFRKPQSMVLMSKSLRKLLTSFKYNSHS